ncbi:TPR repeat-containing protein YrrB [Pirellula sp. SH-Sr6A]|uniref:tetratricopeptide repeat protein n=1 Tax=Pirellula sp. SH-Sr6A TaxID=1632865 RepID=UPI00078D739E|nr:tetratricopeptide repeat protein [Pirellula sp. SH-Sr6A]AMV30635.1 TPR repeat-containing protein YrrB [Pirellula sp. SH-Sr6A]
MNSFSPSDYVVALLNKGVALQQQGKLADAQSLYRQVLEVCPEQPDALHLLGLIEMANGNHVAAIDCIQQALRWSPDSSVFLGNLGVALRNIGRIDEAIATYQRALQSNPEAHDTWFNLGKAYRLQENNLRAEEAFRKAIDASPSTASPYLSLLRLLSEERRVEEALEWANRAIERCRPNVELHLSKGAVLKRLGRIDEAIVQYTKATELSPTSVDALTRLASTHFSRHEIDEGKRWLDRAHQRAPNHHLVLNAIGLLQTTLGNATAAVSFLERSLSENPSYATTFCNYSNALRKLGRLSDALEAIQKGRELDPKNHEALLLEAGCCLSVGDIDTAIERFRSAIALRGKVRDAHDGLLMAMQYHPDITPEKLRDEHDLWWQSVAPETEQVAAPDHCAVASVARNSNLPQRDRPLRIGFTSADLGAHPVGYFTYRLFKHLDRDRFQTFVYSDRIGRDWLAAKIEAETFRWLDAAAWSDEALRDRIRSDEVDILFDLSGHTANNRLGVFASRAAPVQISWAGYVGTTGLQTMDYLLADRFHVPSEFECYYTEKILRMPHGYVTYTPPEDAPPIGELPAERKGYVTFGAMCNPAKINRRVMLHWGEIMRRVPNSRLLLCYTGMPDRMNRERIESAMEGMGCGGRIEFDQTTGAASLMERYHRVDLALDTFPYSGGLTTIEAMWMGIPTVTWPHRTFAGRHSLSHLSNVGLTEFIASSSEEYIAKACAWASEIERLSPLRRTLRQRVLDSPLCDGPQFAKDFEEKMREISSE